MSLKSILNRSLEYSKCRFRGHYIGPSSERRLFSTKEGELNVSCLRCKSPLVLRRKNNKYTIKERYSTRN